MQERCSALSGGNQQKVVIARVFSENPDVIIVAQPTRGVDVGAMEYIHHRLLDLRDGGKSILLISADLDEVPTVWRSSTAAGSWPRASRTPGATWRSAC